MDKQGLKRRVRVTNPQSKMSDQELFKNGEENERKEVQ